MLLNWLLGLLSVFALSRMAKNNNLRPEHSPALFFSEYANYMSYIGAMAKYESGNYKNKLAKDYNNIFSMTTPFQRPQISTGKTKRICNIDNQCTQWQIYNSYSEAIEDLILWLDYNKFPTDLKTVDEFVIELKNKRYFTAPISQYLLGVKKFL